MFVEGEGLPQYDLDSSREYLLVGRPEEGRRGTTGEGRRLPIWQEQRDEEGGVMYDQYEEVNGESSTFINLSLALHNYGYLAHSRIKLFSCALARGLAFHGFALHCLIQKKNI